MTERANVMVCEKIISDETGALTIEWVVLTAGVITLGIAVYGAFKIETDSAFAYSIVSAVTELLALVAQTKLNTMKFVMCNFKSANFASESSTGDLTLVSKFRVWPLMFALCTFPLNATGAQNEFWQRPPPSSYRRISIYFSCIPRTSAANTKI
jgi:hypothetical protein